MINMKAAPKTTSLGEEGGVMSSKTMRFCFGTSMVRFREEACGATKTLAPGGETLIWDERARGGDAVDPL